jgi:hypothetical protein
LVNLTSCYRKYNAGVPNNTVSHCGVATDASSHNAVKEFPFVIKYFDWKNGGLQSKLIVVHQQSSKVAETIVQYIKGASENLL